MTEAAPSSKAKATKPTAFPFGLPNYEMPKFDLPKMDMPEAFREMAEKGVAQAKDTYDKAKAAAEEATDLLRDAYTSAAKGTADYNLKIIEIARANTNAAFDYAKELVGVKSMSELAELSTTHVRRQFEAMAAQTKELTELSQKVASDVAAHDKPLKHSKAS